MTSELITIGELCDAGLAHVQTGPFGSQLHSYDYVECGIPVVPTEAIRDRRIDHIVCPHISPNKADELGRHRLRKGDILFARRGVQATGHIGVVRDREDGFICGTGAILLRVAEGNTRLDWEFLSHFLANPKSIEWFKFHAIGATMPNLNEGIIRSFPLRLPPFTIQKAIAGFLSAIDDKIELNRRMNETLEGMARTLFKDWFVDFGPTRAKVAGHPAYLAPDIWALFPDRLNDENRPEGWESASLASLISIASGGTPKTTVSEYWDGDIPWFSVVDAPSDSDAFVLDTQKHISETGLANSPASILPEGATIITARGTVGKLAIVGTAMAMNQSCYAITGRGGLGSYGTYFLLKRAVGALQANTHGSIFDTITRQTFDAISVVNAPEDILSAYENFAAPLMNRIKANGRQSRALTASRDLLLPKLMSGEIRIRDAETMVAAAA